MEGVSAVLQMSVSFTDTNTCNSTKLC